MLRIALKAVLTTTLILLVGCTTQPVYDVNQAPITASRQPTMADVERAIRVAGASLGWQMTPKGPGQMEGTLNLRTHRAVVDVRYDTQTYSIKYKDSSNLNYDGSNIHKNYNGWIQNLDKAIRAGLAGL
jgi:hypothetical protein